MTPTASVSRLWPRRRPHVLLIVENNSAPGDRRVWLEASSLRRAGYDVSIICPRLRGSAAYEEVDGVRIHRFRPMAESGGQWQFLGSYVWSWLQVARLARRVWAETPFDVIHAANPPDTFFALARLYRRRGVRFLFDEHEPCPEVYDARFVRRSRIVRRALRTLEWLSCSTADRIITVNESCRERIIDAMLAPPEKVDVVRSGPDIARLHEVPADRSLLHGRRHLCVYLGVMGPQDGVETVLRAAEVVVHERGRQDVQFALLGFGPCLESLQELCQELDLGDYVTFTGRADDATISAYLSSAAVGLQPDPKTEFTDLCTMLKTLEYMAFGVPVLAFDLRETRRLCVDAAQYVEAEGAAAYADALLDLLDAPGERGRMGTVGRRRARMTLAWSWQEQVYLRAIESLCGPGWPETALTEGDVDDEHELPA